MKQSVRQIIAQEYLERDISSSLKLRILISLGGTAWLSVSLSGIQPTQTTKAGESDCDVASCWTPEPIAGLTASCTPFVAGRPAQACNSPARVSPALRRSTTRLAGIAAIRCDLRSLAARSHMHATRQDATSLHFVAVTGFDDHSMQVVERQPRPALRRAPRGHVAAPRGDAPLGQRWRCTRAQRPASGALLTAIGRGCSKASHLGLNERGVTGSAMPLLGKRHGLAI